MGTDTRRRGRKHDATAACNDVINARFQRVSRVEVQLDVGPFGLRCYHPGRALVPPGKANKISPPEVHEACWQACHQHSTRRIAVAHAVADHQRWKKLACWPHRRDGLPITDRDIAGPAPHRHHRSLRHSPPADHRAGPAITHQLGRGAVGKSPGSDDAKGALVVRGVTSPTGVETARPPCPKPRDHRGRR